MNKLKVATILGTRPEIIRLSRVTSHFDTVFDHTLIHTGQNYDYELNEIFFEDMELRQPDIFLNAALDSPAETIGKIISEADRVLKDLNPDAVLLLGDTNSCLSAIAAKRQQIPIFHMEAGNRCFDQRVPEETNRRIVDAIADINLPYSTIARDYLIAEGFPANRIIKTGSPMFEVLSHYREKIEASDVLERLNLEENDYFVVSLHREENVEPADKFEAICNTLMRMADQFGNPIIVSTHPRLKARLVECGTEFPETIRFLNPLGFTDYVKLQMLSRTVLSDSGTIYEEASILNFKALNLREAHERPEAMEEAGVIMTGLSATAILQALTLLDASAYDKERTFAPVADYGQGNVSRKMAHIVSSYTGFVRREVWRDFS